MKLSTAYAATLRAAASRLFRETERPVPAIADICGSFDHSASTRACRALPSVTPTQFRRNGYVG